MRYDINATTPETMFPDANWSLVPHHMRDGIARWMMHGGYLGGFLEGLVTNDLMKAAGRADDANLAALGNWCRFLGSHAPMGCYGSKEHVNNWSGHAGLAGLEKRLAGLEKRAEARHAGA